MRLASAGPSGARTQGGRIAELFGRLRTPHRAASAAARTRGGDELLDAFRAAAEGDDDLFVTGFECLGACDIAPMASIDERYFGPLEAAEAATAIEQLRAGADVLPEKALAKRPLPGGPDA